MSSEFDQLVRLLPPPSGEVAGAPWQLSRPEIGLDFPADFREFVDRYGGGDVVRADGSVSMSIYGLHSGESRPGSGRGFSALMKLQEEQIRPSFVFDGATEDYWGGTVYPVQPDPGGLLAWGENLDGDIFFWLTEDPDPDRWPVVMWARGPATTYRFDGGMVPFLVSVFTDAHPDVGWLAGPGLAWVMRQDWLGRDLSESAGAGA